MGQTIDLTASDGHSFKAYRADPAGTPKAGVVIIQEIFGVNRHIRSVVDRFAADGFVAIAPQIYDRHAPDTELGYSDEEVEQGRAVRVEVGFDNPVLDIAAATACLTGEGLATFAIGYCYGGALAWLSASRVTGLSGAIGYYGTAAAFREEAPGCPVLLHYGELDAMIPHTDGDSLVQQYPEMVEAYVYPAGHGFNCDLRGSYHAASADLALDRTLSFIAANR